MRPEPVRLLPVPGTWVYLDRLDVAPGEVIHMDENGAVKFPAEKAPQVLENATFPRRVPVEAMSKMQAEVARVEKKLGQSGRVLVRWSGTEPKLRVMVEGEDAATIERYAKEIVGAATNDIAAL